MHNKCECRTDSSKYILRRKCGHQKGNHGFYLTQNEFSRHPCPVPSCGCQDFE